MCEATESYRTFFISDDHSRVTLTPIEGHEHDYINGNFIDVSWITMKVDMKSLNSLALMGQYLHLVYMYL